ncbi:MAG: helix-turn-helix transcriptional regulator [Cereibacter sphaeroides]|uniref:Helix-turn-helix transcriptional regulator n=1 Tax=Cereibacter sphaeroides TaxID=1063 RepID=A0A2W5S901_CERSP|nr:MAG: helix-turn-helix transcriptional regulator [Cereibacter sphaeroides]
MWNRESGILIGLILFQSACTVFFLGDVLADIRGLGWSGATLLVMLPELAAVMGLFSAVGILSVYLVRLLRRQAQMERGMSVAQGALADLMQGYFDTWQLTPSEADVATFTIKGYSIAEIAALRGSAETTVKTHLNAIYRKAGVTGRGQLVSLLVEDLMGGPLAGVTPRAVETTSG